MSHTKQYLGLDIGGARVGVALANANVRIAIPFGVIELGRDQFRSAVTKLVADNDIETIVVGYPRNQSGEATAQTGLVEAKAAELSDIDAKIVFQDESLTSVIAEQRLNERGETYEKADIDTEAAVIILQDYLEQHI